MITAELPRSLTTHPAGPSRRVEDDGLRTAASALLRSSGYAGLRRLRCEVTDAEVVVHGVLPSYHLKQMAQAVLLRLDGVRGVKNLVEVRYADRQPPVARDEGQPPDEAPHPADLRTVPASGDCEADGLHAPALGGPGLLGGVAPGREPSNRREEAP